MNNNNINYSFIKFNVLWAPLYYLVLLLSGYLSPEEILIVYAFETLIIGGFHFAKMISAGIAQDKMKGSVLISLFFLLHYSIFCFGQLFLFFAVLNVYIGADADFFDKVIYFLQRPEIKYPLLTMIPLYLFNLWSDFISKGLANKVEIGSFMFLPYVRVFIQQFVGIFPYFIVIFFGLNQKIIAAVVLIILRGLFEFFIQWIKTNPDNFMRWAVKLRPKEKPEADAYREISEVLQAIEKAAGMRYREQ